MEPPTSASPRPTVKWVVYMYAPIFLLIAITLLQVIVHFNLPQTSSTGLDVNSGQQISRAILNIFTIFGGLASIIMLFLIPLWVSKLIRDRRYNLQNGFGLDKKTAVVMAIFLGTWAWLYTPDKDLNKFWINLGLSIVSVGYWSIIAWLWIVITSSSRPPEFYRAYQPKTVPATTVA